MLPKPRVHLPLPLLGEAGSTLLQTGGKSHRVPVVDDLLALVRSRVRRTVRFFYGYLVPLFFCCPVAVRCLSGCLSCRLSGSFRYVLIFLVVTDSYDRPPLSGCPFDHLFGFESGQKPLNRTRGPSPSLGKPGSRRAELPSFKGDGLALDVEFRWLPARLSDYPEPCAKAGAIAFQEMVFARLALHGDEAGQSVHPISSGVRSLLARLQTLQARTRFSTVS